MGRHKGKKQVLVYLSPALHQRLRLEAARRSVSMSAMVEQALESRLAPRLKPLADDLDAQPNVVEALAGFGAPLWSTGRATDLTLEQAVAGGLELARHRPTLLRVLPVVLCLNRSRVSWPGLRAEVARESLGALGMLLELTAELTGIEAFRRWALELEPFAEPGAAAPFFRDRPASGRYLALARERTPEVARRWGFVLATPLDDFRSAMERFCPDLVKDSVGPS
jgi:hypothetical protein